MRNGEFRNAVALVTGAAGGIGRCVCARFEAAGARVYKTDVASWRTLHFIRGDITHAGFIRRLLQHILKEAGRIDILVNNAGICPRTTLTDITRAEWRKVLDINLSAAFWLSQECMRIMERQRCGVIINVASLAGKVGGITVGAHYSASKAALECLTKSLARYGASRGVRANAVAPGVIDTEINRTMSVAQRKKMMQTIPLGRMATAEEVAGPILFLASREASYITGATLDINGGLLMD